MKVVSKPGGVLCEQLKVKLANGFARADRWQGRGSAQRERAEEGMSWLVAAALVPIAQSFPSSSLGDQACVQGQHTTPLEKSGSQHFGLVFVAFPFLS